MTDLTKVEAEKKIMALLGFAQKAGKILSGDDLVIAAVERNKAKLVLTAEDCAENTKKKFMAVIRKTDIPYYVWGEKAALGLAIGKSPRSMVALIDEGFTKAIIKILE